MLETLLSRPDPQQVGTPEAVARQRMIADALLKAGSDYSPVQSWTQGMARVVDALGGSLRERRANALEKSGMDADKANLGALAGSMFGGGTAAPAAGASPVASPQAEASPVPVPHGDLAKQAFDYFTAKGYTPAAAAGLVGNFTQESGFSPANISAADGGGGDGGASKYLAQWNGSRLTALNQFAAANGKSPRDFQTQLDFVHNELNGSEKATGMALRGVTDPVRAAAIAAGYERPQGWKAGGDPAAINGWSNRRGYALDAFNKWGQPQQAASPVAGVQVASNDPNFAPQMSAQTAPVGPGASLSPQDMATLTARMNAPPGPAQPVVNPMAPRSPQELAAVGGLTDTPLPPGAAVAPPGLGPMAAGPAPVAPPQVPQPAPVTTAALPPQAAAAPPQAAPQGAKDSIIQMMIARGINPATGAPANPAVSRVAQALGGAPQTAAAAPSPAVAQVAQAMTPPATVPAAPAAAPAPVAGAPQGNSAQLQAAMKAISNPYASEATKQMATLIIQREMQSSDPMRQLQLRKLQQELAVPQKQWQKLDDTTLFDPATGETKGVTGAGPKPLFDTKSVEGQGLNWLVQNNKLTAEQASQVAAGKTITDPATGAMIFMTPQGIFGQAAPGGPAQPIVPPGGPAATPTAVPGAAPAAPVPGQQAGMIPITAGKPAAKLTEAEQKNKMLTGVMAPELDIIDKNFGALAQLGNQAGSMVPLISNYLTSPGFQQAQNSLKTVISSYLYSVSGATASPKEIDNQASILTPKPGDAPDVIKEKLSRVHNMVDAVRGAGGPAGAPAAPAPAPVAQPPVAGARLAPNGKWYLKNPAYGTDPSAPQWFEVQP